MSWPLAIENAPIELQDYVFAAEMGMAVPSGVSSRLQHQDLKPFDISSPSPSTIHFGTKSNTYASARSDTSYSIGEF